MWQTNLYLPALSVTSSMLDASSPFSSWALNLMSAWGGVTEPVRNWPWRPSNLTFSPWHDSAIHVSIVLKHQVFNIGNNALSRPELRIASKCQWASTSKQVSYLHQWWHRHAEVRRAGVLMWHWHEVSPLSCTNNTTLFLFIATTSQFGMQTLHPLLF